jgi:lysozyme family protein
MANLTKAQATTILRALGWRVRSTAEYTRTVKNFQAGWNLGPALKVDGLVGAGTSAALLKSENNRRKGLGTASAHFDFAEMQCRCRGKYTSCQRIWAKRKTFVMMEQYRTKSKKPFTVVSGCRCTSHNKAVGGSRTSRHVTGLASDVKPLFSTKTVKSWRVATHIGYGSVSKKVVHIDLGSGATKTNPRIYVDGK